MRTQQTTVYLETTVVSYLTARPSRDVITLAHQEITRDWWERERARYVLFVSELVVREASGGDPGAAARRLEAVEGIPLLEIGAREQALAQDLLAPGPIPAEYPEDALHIAVAAVNGIRYLLPWNCTHINNALLRVSVGAACEARGYRSPIICTPEELAGG